MNQKKIYENALWSDKSSVARLSSVAAVMLATGFLVTSSLPKSDYIEIKKSKCSEIERYSPNQAVHSALQTMTRENTRNENGKSKILSVKLIRLDLCVVAGKS